MKSFSKYSFLIHSPFELLEEDTNVHVLLGVEDSHLAREKREAIILYGQGLTMTDCFSFNVYYIINMQTDRTNYLLHPNVFNHL